MRTCLLILIILTGPPLLTAADERPVAERMWQVGVASVDITPEYPVRLSGYGSRREEFDGVAQRIVASALAIGSDADGPAVLVTVDNCGVPAAMREEVVRRLSAATQVRDERFAVASTHTHCAPMLDGVLPNLFSSEIPESHRAAILRYTAELTDRIEDVALAALADRRPGRLASGRGRVGFAANRRRYPLKPVDHELPVLRVTDRDGNVRGILTNYACHCTTIGINSIHGDWAGCAREALERDFPGAVALTAIGCGADQNPTPRRTMELVRQYGEALAAEAGSVVRGELTPLGGPLKCRTQEIELAFDTLPTRAEWESLAAAAASNVAYHAKKNLARIDRGESLPTTLPYLVQTWTFGDDLAMVFLPGEVVVDYGLRIKREFDDQRVWVNGYANDVPCYIPSRRVLDEGGYEGAGAMVYYDRPTRFASDVEERILTAVHDLMPDSFLADDSSASRFAQPVTLPPQDQVHLYLLLGQSNMAGRGRIAPQDLIPDPRVVMLNRDNEWVPAIAPLHFDKPVAGVGIGRRFGQLMADASPGVTIALIPCAVGGSPIDAWQPGAFYEPTGSHPWDDALRRAKHALAFGRLKGILWHQGESDSRPERAAEYEDKLHDLVRRLRRELEAPDVPFVVGQMGQFPERPWDEARRTVDQAHRGLPSTVDRTAFVSSDGLIHKGDEVHFDAASYRELGRRYADAMTSLHSENANHRE